MIYCLNIVNQIVQFQVVSASSLMVEINEMNSWRRLNREIVNLKIYEDDHHDAFYLKLFENYLVNLDKF